MMGNRHRTTSMAYAGNVSDEEMKKSIKSLADLKSVYKDIRYDWPLLIQGEVTPLELAISFLDDTSVGLAHKKSEFDELCEATGKALKAAVVENHETFNNSIGLYHLLISIAQDSQRDSKVIKNLIETSTKDMKDRSTSLKNLDQSSTKYSEMIEILDAMAYLRDIPGKIDQLITEKKIHEVYDVIADGYKTASMYNLWSLSSMNATQSYLEVQSNNLYDMIVDELQNEIYLKSTLSSKESWSNVINTSSPEITSFMTLINNLTTLELYIYNSANLDINEISTSLTESTEKFLKSHLPQLHEHHRKGKSQKTNYALLLESNLSPSTASYFYIYLLLSTASKLNKLQSIMQILLNSLHQELQYMTLQISEECKLLNIHKLARLEKARALEQNTPLDIISGQSLHDLSVHILQDYFGSFFFRYLMVLLKHKVACEIVNKIRETSEVSSYQRKGLIVESSQRSYNFLTVWTIVSKEVKSLVENYIHAEKNHLNSVRSDLTPSRIHEVLAKKQLFKLEDAFGFNSNESSNELKSAFDEMFPGFLMSSRKTKSDQITSNTPYITMERLSSSVDALVPINVFNMRIIVEYFLIFVNGASSLFLDFKKNKTLDTPPFGFFKDIMHKSFLRGIKEQLHYAFDACMTTEMGVELRDKKDTRFNQTIINLSERDLPFELLEFAKPSQLQVYLNAVQFEQILNNACFTLNTSFNYRKHFSGSVFEILKSFSAFYSDYYAELLATGGSHDITEINLGFQEERTQRILKLNKWMNTAVLTEASKKLLLIMSDQDKANSAISKECDLMFFENRTGHRALEASKDDLLDDNTFHHVCVLLKTVSWVLTWLPAMRKMSSISNSEGSKIQINNLRQEFTILENGRAPMSTTKPAHHVYLTLDQDSIGAFDEVIKTFENIREKALIALRYDLRLKTMHHISQSFADNFVLTTEPADSDPFISLFNREVFFIGTKADEILSNEERKFIFMGLPAFISRSFIKGSESVAVINRNGIKRIILNIFTTQQMLRSVIDKQEKVDLSVSSKYYELFTFSEHNLLQKVSLENISYTKDELLNLLRLMYSERLESSSVTAFNRTRYNELVKKVSDLIK